MTGQFLHKPKSYYKKGASIMKKNSKVIIAFLLMLLLITQLTSPVSALIQYDGVSVTPIQQAKRYWCWAACAEMVGKYFKPDTSKTQWDVVRATKGTEDEPYPDVSGTAPNSPPL